MSDETVQKPRNTTEIIRWLIFEPGLLREYSDSLKSWRARLQAMVTPLIWIAVGSCAVYLLTGAVLAFFDLPVLSQKADAPILIAHLEGDFVENFRAYLEVSYLEFLKILAVGLAGGLAVGLALGLAVGLALGLAGGLAVGLAYGLGFFGGWMVFYYRLYTYGWYAFWSFFERYSLKKNPHRRDGVIGFPIPGMEEQFKKEGYENPGHGFEFSRFVFKRREQYQRRLALQVDLASTAGQWKTDRNHAVVLKDYPFAPEEYATREVRHDWILFKTTGTQRLFESPTPDWYTQLETTRQHLSDFEQESNVQRRLRYFRAYQTELQRLCDIALRQPREWGEYFVKALELWKKSAADTLRDLELEAAAEEPIAANIYRGGEKLKPEDTELFFGRNDLRDAFKNRVVTAVQMPLFFIQGQRRVGKSSLIAFLPTFLDRRFTVVAYDMQEQPGITLPALLQTLRERIHKTVLSTDAPELELPADWLLAWGAFKDELDGIAQNREAKIVLAIDEYEELHRILQTDPGQGGKLLAAMRSWSQSQNRVVLLFAGADFFSEMKSPNWAEYFVQSERLLVDYLGHDDSLALINLVGLKYPPELLERMYHETQGHPCLLQKICREVVTIANKTGRESRAIVEADYEEALRLTLLMPDDGVVNIFWQQFCENRKLKDTIRQILRGEAPSDERGLLVLEDHGFIVRDAAVSAHWRLRVPLFELWLRRYQVT